MRRRPIMYTSVFEIWALLQDIQMEHLRSPVKVPLSCLRPILTLPGHRRRRQSPHYEEGQLENARGMLLRDSRWLRVHPIESGHARLATASG